MDHLRALCAILQTDLNKMVGGEIEVMEGAVDVAIARAARDLTDAQKELLLALARSLNSGAG